MPIFLFLCCNFAYTCLYDAGGELSSANQSEMLMMEVFPELEESSNIIFNTPSKKALKRFVSVNALPPRLGKSHWAHSILKDTISRNVREVAVSSLQGVKVSSKQRRAAVDRYIEVRQDGLETPKSRANVRKQLRRDLIYTLLNDRSWEGK